MELLTPYTLTPTFILTHLYTHLNTTTHTHMHINIHLYIHLHLQTPTHLYTHLHTHTHLHLHLHTNTYTSQQWNRAKWYFLRCVRCRVFPGKGAWPNRLPSNRVLFTSSSTPPSGESGTICSLPSSGFIRCSTSSYETFVIVCLFSLSFYF